MRKASTRLSQYTGAAPPACHLPGCQARMKRRQVLLPGSFFAKNRKRNKVRYVQSMKGLGERVWRGGRCTWRETGKKSRNWRAEVFNCGRITPTNSKKKKKKCFWKIQLEGTTFYSSTHGDTSTNSSTGGALLGCCLRSAPSVSGSDQSPSPSEDMAKVWQENTTQNQVLSQQMAHCLNCKKILGLKNLS